MKIKIWLLVFASAFVASCSDGDKAGNVFPYSEFSDVRDSISLEQTRYSAMSVEVDSSPSAMIGDVNRIAAGGDYFFVSSNNLLLQFSAKDGKFVRTVSAQGRGPNEYLSIMDFAVDGKKKVLYIMDDYKTLSFDFYGSPVAPAVKTELGMSIAVPSDGTLLVYPFNMMGNAVNKLVALDTKGDTLRKFENHQQFEMSMDGFFMLPINSVFTYGVGGNTLFRQQFSDTVFRYSAGEKSLVPEYTFDFGDNAVSPAILSKGSEELFKHTFVSEFYETKSYFHIILTIHGTDRYYIKDKSTGKVYLANLKLEGRHLLPVATTPDNRLIAVIPPTEEAENYRFVFLSE